MAARLPVKLLSFGYKNRDPAKLGVLQLFDLRQVKPNPHHEASLRDLDGRDLRIQQFVLAGGELQAILSEAEKHVDRESLGPTIAFGCVGGRHRSVVAVEVLASKLKAKGIEVVVNHLELGAGTDSMSFASSLPSSSLGSPPTSLFLSPVVRAFSSSSFSPSTSPSSASHEAKSFDDKVGGENGGFGGRGRGKGKARFQGRTPAGHFSIERQFDIYGSSLKLWLCRGDITVCPVEAIVNAANLACLGGKGVDGAIHAAAGPELKAHCEKLPEVRTNVRCAWGDAKITPAAKLPAPIRYVIHAVGPIHPASEFWGDKRSKWQIDFAPSQVGKLLRSAYDASFARCAENNIKSVGFPAISCGVFGFPYEAATRIALESILAHANSPSLEKVLLVGLEQPAWDAYTTVCNSLIEQGVLREVAVDFVSPPVDISPPDALPSSLPAPEEVSVIHPQLLAAPQAAATPALSPSARRRLRKQKQEHTR